MPSDEEFRELKDQVASLTSALATARRRIDDLEDGMADHLGLDWGESLVDVNSPHPNISANTIESGGGVIRQDANGMQVETNSATYPAVRFVQALVPDPSSEAPMSALNGYVSSSESRIDITANAPSDGTARIWASASDSTSVVEISAYDTGTVGPKVELTGTSSVRRVSVGGSLALTSALSPAEIGANQDDYNPTNLYTSTVIRLTSDASRDITGIIPTDNLLAGQVLILLNVGATNDIVLKNESVSSTAAYRFAIGADITLGPNEGAGILYDPTSARWRCFGKHV